MNQADTEYQDSLDYLCRDICLHRQYIFYQVYLDLVELELDLVLAQSKESDSLDLEELGCLELGLYILDCTQKNFIYY